MIDFRRPIVDSQSAGRRIFFCLLILVFFLRVTLRHWPAVDPIFWAPISLFQFLPHPASSGFLRVVEIAFPLLCAANILWRRWPLSGATFLCAFFVLGYGNNFGKVANGACLLVIALFLDFFLLALQRLGRIKEIELEEAFVWLVYYQAALFYFLSGAQKSWLSGADWVWSDNLTNILFDYASPVGIRLADFPALNQLAAFIVVALEISAPLAFFWRWHARLFPFLAVAMHLGIFLFTGISFFLHCCTLTLLFTVFRRGLSPGKKTVAFPLAAALTLLTLAQLHLAPREWWPFSSFNLFSHVYEGQPSRILLRDDSGQLHEIGSFAPLDGSALEARLDRAQNDSAETRAVLSAACRLKNLPCERAALFRYTWKNYREKAEKAPPLSVEKLF